jgi:ABC-type polysaccharide/polyol phosphate transport system ATPase subunit
MYRTITVGTCVSVQGEFVRQLCNGKILVKVGEKIFEGSPTSLHQSEPSKPSDQANV